MRRSKWVGGASSRRTSPKRVWAPAAPSVPAPPTTDPIVTGVNADGWSVAAASPPTLQPESAPLFARLTRQGFDAAGQTASHAGELILTQRVRLPFPNQAQLDASRVALSDYVYATDTVRGGQPNASAETSPKPVARWALPDRATVGTALRLEVVAAHRNARGGEMVAAVRFTATDGTNTVSAIVPQSSILAHAGDRNPVIGYAATLDVSALADGQITANAEVFPWIGGASSVLRSSDSAAGARAFCPQVFRKAAFRPVLFAYVAAGGSDASGVASADAGAAAAAPCQTVAGAIAKIRAADAGAVTDGHVVRIAAGAQALGTPAAVAHSAISELVVEADPAAAPGSASLALSANWNSRQSFIRFRNLTITRSGSAQIGGSAAPSFVTFETCAYANGGANISAVQNNAAFRWLGCTLTGMTNAALAPGASAQHQLVRGCTSDAAASFDPFCALGNSVANATFAPATAAQEGGFVAFNRFNLQAGSAVVMASLGNVDGAAVIQNLIEFTSISTTSPAFRFSGDGNPGNVTHLVCAHNTLTGFGVAGRGNVLYADTPATNRTHRLCAFVGNIHASVNVKTDIFAADGTLTNAWAYMYGVGCRGEFAQFKDAGPAPTGGAGHGSFQQAFPGMKASIGSSATARNDPLFVDYKGTASATVAGTGGGTYALQAGSPARAAVADPVLRFDIAGLPRPAANDAAGAHAG